MLSDNEPFFTVGIVTGMHGLRGELRVLPRTDFVEERFKPGSVLWLRHPGQLPHLQVTVATARSHKQFYLILCREYTDINQVSEWKGMEFCVPKSALMQLPEGSFYIHQLIGLEVHTETGELLGQLVEVLQPGANDVYVVRGPTHKQDILIPAIASCVLQVNIAQGRMVVHLLPGLLDE
ncbi:ribosome maturation factor RimM [Alicyclobacillaceae bacterium I2511]|nr:ribosome maturation factor RimM [Alicyclobacillaceae bacterium I2511]